MKTENTDHEIRYTETPYPKDTKFPTIQEQQQYWKDKEILDNPEIVSNNATNETRHVARETLLDIEVALSRGDLEDALRCVERGIERGIQAFLCGHDGHTPHVSKTAVASHLSKSDSTTADPKPKEHEVTTLAKAINAAQDDDLSRTEATTDYLDHLDCDMDGCWEEWSLRDEGRNDDGTGESYAERQV